MDLFDNLPLVAIISKKFICMHGGINPYMVNDVNEINRIKRN